MPELSLFLVEDLFEKRNLNQVLKTLQMFSDICEKINSNWVWVPTTVTTLQNSSDETSSSPETKKLDTEKIEKEKLEKENQEKERLEKEEKEKLEKERIEKDRIKKRKTR